MPTWSRSIPVWTTADITRNFSLAVYDTLYGYDAQFNVQPQMVEGTKTENDGKMWELTLRDGLTFHDGTPVLAKDCVATIQRFSKRYPFGQALMSRTDELTAPSDKVIRFRLNKPFAAAAERAGRGLLRDHAGTAGQTDPMKQVTEAIGSGPFKFVAIGTHFRLSAWCSSRMTAYVPRKDGVPSFNAGPKIVYIDRVVWNFIQDPATASAALDAGRNRLVGKSDDRPGAAAQTQQGPDRRGQGPHRRNRLPALQPSVSAVRQCRRSRRVVLAAIDQKEIMEAVAGAEPS